MIHKSIIIAICLAMVVCFTNPASASVEAMLTRADSLYAQRINTDKTEEALAIYRQAHDSSPDNAEAAMKLGRCLIWLAVIKENDESPDMVEEAVDVLSPATEKHTDNPGLHYWLGTAYALQANEGPITALRVMGRIREHLNRVLELNPGYEYGGAYRVLGRLDAKAPGFLGGDKAKAEELIKKAISLAPEYWHNHLFLADLYYKTDRNKQALAILNKVLSSSPQPGLEAEHKIWLKEANGLLGKIQDQLRAAKE